MSFVGLVCFVLPDVETSFRVGDYWKNGDGNQDSFGEFNFVHLRFEVCLQ